MFNPKHFAESAKKQRMEAAIIMVTFNRWQLTEISLTSIFKNTFMPYTLTVIDNGSWDETQGKLKEFRREGKIHKLILLPENIGIGMGKNFGLKAWENKANWYACIDNDIEVSPFWLAYLCYVSSLPKQYCDKWDGLGVIGANVQGFGIRKELKWFTVTHWKTVNGVVLDNSPNPGGIYVFSAKTFSKLGYFREWSLYGLEDSDYHTRQNFHNLRSVYVGNVKCQELPCLSLDKETRMQNGENYRDFKTRSHNLIVEKVKKAKQKAARHYETKVTHQQIEKYTWEPN